jgi:hypothetical protein
MLNPLRFLIIYNKFLSKESEFIRAAASNFRFLISWFLLLPLNYITLPLQQAPMFQHRCDIGLTSPKFHKHFIEIFSIAA